MFREKWYEWKNWREMVHTTWNPKDPGAVRIHLIPPKFQLFRFVPSVAILNGNQIIPVNESWAILLTEFIRQLNTFGDGEMPEEALEKILENTCRNVKKVYPDVDPEELLESIHEIEKNAGRERVIHWRRSPGYLKMWRAVGSRRSRSVRWISGLMPLI
jgi:hypothetical protein